MKNLIQYLKLWQKKRSELRIDEDVDTDWSEMHTLLDKHMPDGGASDGAIKKRGINLLSMMLITLSAAAMIYVTAKVVHTKIQASHHKSRIHHKHKGVNAANDSLALSDSSNQTQDSTAGVKQLLASKSDTFEKSSVENSRQPGKSDSRGINPSVKVTGAGKNNLAVNKGTVTKFNAPSSTNKPIPLNRYNAATRNNTQNSGYNQIINNAFSTKNTLTNDLYDSRGTDLVLLDQSIQSFNPDGSVLSTYPTLGYKNIVPRMSITSLAKAQKNKTKNRPGNGNNSIDWGILIGANSNGSFTAKNLNSNFYGSLPADIFTGIYGTYNINTKWGIGTQITILSPTIAQGGTYTRSYLSYTDSVTKLKYKNVSDSKKIYSVQVPLFAVYHITKNIDFKAGGAISFPVKQLNTTTQVDSVSRSIITHSHYDQKTDYSLLGGVSYRYKMLIFEASYLKGLTTHSIVSDSLIHKSTNSTFQFTIKFQLGGNKK